MDNVNWLKFKLDKKMSNMKSTQTQISTNLLSANNNAQNLVQQTQKNIINNVQRQFVNPQSLKMNNLASIDRAVYVKDILNLPKNMVELLVLVQNMNNKHQIKPQKPVQNQEMATNKQQELLQNKQEIVQNNIHNNKGQNPQELILNSQRGINQRILNNPHNAFHNTLRNNVKNNIINNQIQQDAEAVNQLQTNNQKIQNMSPEELTAFKQNLASQLNSNVNLSRVSALLQQNSKVAMNKMISMMTMATSQGMRDVSPLQDTINVINASVSATSQNDSTQTLKNLMLLYLPWLPLQEGVGFDLEVEKEESNEKSDTLIKILITTVNYGNLHATVSLITTNSVDVDIICSEKFPKKELLKCLLKEGSQHSMQAEFAFSEQKPQEQLDVQTPKAKVNLSNVSDVNPYLLLMSHAIIRHTIELDATISIGKQPIQD